MKGTRVLPFRTTKNTREKGRIKQPRMIYVVNRMICHVNILGKRMIYVVNRMICHVNRMIYVVNRMICHVNILRLVLCLLRI